MKKLLFLFALCAFTVSAAFSQDDQYYTGDEATVTQKAQEAPPALPEYTQPPCPEDGYIWTPGYWAWGVGSYYWVPGVWVMPPSADLLWTPGYWGFYHGYYGWHGGYWGATVGYYGGINYGFGYGGTGFYGGRWEGGHFLYNSAVWHVNGGIVHNHVYMGAVPHVNVSMHASFNGPGGIRYRPGANEMHAMQERHVAPTHNQVAHRQAAVNDRGQSYRATGGRPAYHSMSRPGGQRYDARGASHGGGARSAPRGGGARPTQHGGGERR